MVKLCSPTRHSYNSGIMYVLIICMHQMQHHMLKVKIEKLDCVLSKKATRPYIYGHTSANAYVRIYV